MDGMMVRKEEGRRRWLTRVAEHWVGVALVLVPWFPRRSFTLSSIRFMPWRHSVQGCYWGVWSSVGVHGGGWFLGPGHAYGKAF